MELSFGLLLTAAAVYLLAGSVKGTIGLGLPTTAVSVMAQVTDARTAIALVLVPMIVTNFWQILRAGDARGALWRYRWLALVQVLGIGLVSQLAGGFSVQRVEALLGAAIVLFAVSGLWRETPALAARHDRRAQIAAGTAAGALGGVAGIWAPPVVVYLQARRVSPDEFVRATGLLLCLGSVVLFGGYWRLGFVTPGTAAVSCALLLPALLGYATGERLRGRLSGEGFRRAVLVFFLLMGLNLLYRALLA